jgi:hypothetical protein
MRQKHELTVPWKDFLAVLDRIDEIEAETSRITDERIRTKDHDYMRKEHNALWDEYHVLDKKRDEMRPHVIPEVGATGTIHWYSDSSKAKVTRVISPKKIEVTACGLYSCTKICTYRTNGHWVQEGTTSRDWGTLFSFGRGHDYYDQSY